MKEKIHDVEKILGITAIALLTIGIVGLLLPRKPPTGNGLLTTIPTRESLPITRHDAELFNGSAYSTEEMTLVTGISISILSEIILPWERNNLKHLPIEEEFADQLTAILIPPHPEELVLKARREFEKKLALAMPQDRVSAILPAALREWQYVNCFTDRWTLVTKDSGGELYRERFSKKEQLILKDGGGFNINRDEEPSGTIYPFPSYGQLKPVNIEDRYSLLFGN